MGMQSSKNSTIDLAVEAMELDSTSRVFFFVHSLCGSLTTLGDSAGDGRLVVHHLIIIRRLALLVSIITLKYLLTCVNMRAEKDSHMKHVSA